MRSVLANLLFILLGHTFINKALFIRRVGFFAVLLLPSCDKQYCKWSSGIFTSDS